jgi:mono/diheme cytochrome c family protein
MRGEWYQLSMIFLAVVVTALFGVFVYRELFPEYKIYQNAYVDLEEFRSTYTGQPPPPFVTEVKQIVIERPDKGPPVIDRCISCHIALQYSHFSPTQIAYDINGNILYDEAGIPLQEPNPDYVWDKLEQKAADLEASGDQNAAEKLLALKTVQVGEHIYDMTKVLRAHPTIGRETRPFEHHNIEELGCTVCHSGNGRGLTTQKAHGPVFDGQYEPEASGPTPTFLEKDPLNDPLFSRVFNHKPSHELLFQTTPLYVGALLQANCVQCHSSSSDALQDAAAETEMIVARREEKSNAVKNGYTNEKEALIALLELRSKLQEKDLKQILDELTTISKDEKLSESDLRAAKSQLAFLQKQSNAETALEQIDSKINVMVGSEELSQKLIAVSEADLNKQFIEQFILDNRQDPSAKGTLFEKKNALDEDKKLLVFARAAESTINETAKNENVQGALASEIDRLTTDFHRGGTLFISQACYACHRIDGLSRGGIGPELTREGFVYPWFIKESMVWPQADLHTSTMPNFHLDHEELEDLTTFLLAQRGRRQAVSETTYKAQMLKWEAGYKLPWEQPVNPGELLDLRHSLSIFATEGCAACHRLKGFESDVGFQIEKEGDPGFDALFQERQWFRRLIPEDVTGSELVEILSMNAPEIDNRIVDGVRSGSLLEELDDKTPKTVESFNSNFKFARRAKNHLYKQTIAHTTDPDERSRLKDEWNIWKERVNRVLMMYAQEYGLGRLIGPRPNWSGIYRSDEWLMEHFKKPTQTIPRSIMPVFPFDDTKFYALTYMLDQLAKKNRDEVRQIWNTYGFDPSMAFDIHCSQCHGEHRGGNGPVSEWIYPIPKNLRNADFLRHLTRANAIESIRHGVKGGPMPPWGEVAKGKWQDDGTPVLTLHEIEQLVDWLFSSLAGRTSVPEDQKVDKWQYGPEDVLRELENEKLKLDPESPTEQREPGEFPLNFGLCEFPKGDDYLVSLNPTATLKEDDSNGRIGAVFAIRPSPIKSSQEDAYYIKKQYYTQENLNYGKELFELNCAVCHGNEADGQGLRSSMMFDAKPRMLTNFQWIGTRDDMRLLRSIKYGVPGTSMTPWGDQTNTLQRLQLVMYIRSLTQDQEQRSELSETLYKAFDEKGQMIDRTRSEQYGVVNQLKSEMAQLKNARLLRKSSEELSREERLEDYQKEMELDSQLQDRLDADKQLKEVKEELKKEAQIFQMIGSQFLAKSFEGDVFGDYLKLVELHSPPFSIEKGKLAVKDSGNEEVKERLKKKLYDTLQEGIREAEAEKEVWEGKLSSQKRTEKLTELREKLKAYRNLQTELISGLEEAKRLRERQLEHIASYENILKTLNRQE